jgi:NAD(P)-dependent dehydrogenase (short-subunit alcohol dehydrogenase family)
MKGELAGKRAIVTGAAEEIGAATVVLAGRSERKLDETTRSLAEAGLPKAFQDPVRASCLVPRVGAPRDVAEVVLASDRSSYLTGQVLSVDGGFFAHVPTLASVRDLMASKP